MTSKIIWIIVSIAITLIITGTQKYLSTRKIWQLGAVVPLLSLVVMATIYFTTHVTLSVKFIVPCAIILVLELFIWIDGRHQYRKDELMRMTAKDIN